MNGILGFCGGARGARRKIISGIDRARGAPPGIGSGGLGIDTCANRTRVYLNFVLLFVFLNGILGFCGGARGARRKIISGIDRARGARSGIGSG